MPHEIELRVDALKLVADFLEEAAAKRVALFDESDLVCFFAEVVVIVVVSIGATPSGAGSRLKTSSDALHAPGALSRRPASG